MPALGLRCAGAAGLGAWGSQLGLAGRPEVEAGEEEEEEEAGWGEELMVGVFCGGSVGKTRVGTSEVQGQAGSRSGALGLDMSMDYGPPRAAGWQVMAAGTAAIWLPETELPSCVTAHRGSLGAQQRV